MEIPYEVKARPDTGLWNAKIGIWLFLASEVMLFGGLFSGYLFLRLGAGGEPDYYWPEGVLKVLPGFINTIVLILSSVFVVVAWLQLKLRNYEKYRFWMALVVLCSLAFLCIKAYEYSGKFKHYGIRLSDGSIVEGHGMSDDIKYDNITDIEIDVARFNGAFLGDVIGDNQPQFHELTANAEGVMVPTGDAFALTKKKIAEIVDRLNAAKKEQVEKDNEVVRAANEKIAEANKGLPKVDQAPLEEINEWYPADGVGKLSFRSTEPFSIKTTRNGLRKNPDYADAAKYKDQTVLRGQISADTPGVVLHAVDRIDLRASKGETWNDSLVWGFLGHDVHHGEDDKKSAVVSPLTEGNAGDEGAKGDHDGEHKKTPKEEAAEAKRIFGLGYEMILVEAKEAGTEANWSELMNHSVAKFKHTNEAGDKEKLSAHPPIVVPWEHVRLYSNFTPKWNTYYAIYFTLTGLHGLHVLIGAGVLFYFGFMSKWLYDKNPEHLANRVEVGGLFWHFVDLVWIFLFPILYLM